MYSYDFKHNRFVNRGITLENVVQMDTFDFEDHPVWVLSRQPQLKIIMNIDSLTGAKIWTGSGILLAGVLGQFICKWRTQSLVSGTAYDVFMDKRLLLKKTVICIDKCVCLLYYNTVT